MPDVFLGTIESKVAGDLNRVLADSKSRLSPGVYQLIGAADASGHVTSGAMTQDIGNSQWMVYLLNEEQLKNTVQSHLASLESGIGAGANGINVESLNQGVDALAVGLHAVASGGANLPLHGLTKLADMGTAVVETATRTPGLTNPFRSFEGRSVSDDDERWSRGLRD